MKGTEIILVNEDRDVMDKTPSTRIRTATCNVFIKNSTGNKLLHRELINTTTNKFNRFKHNAFFESI